MQGRHAPGFEKTGFERQPKANHEFHARRHRGDKCFAVHFFTDAATIFRQRQTLRKRTRRDMHNAALVQRVEILRTRHRAIDHRCLRGGRFETVTEHAGFGCTAALLHAGGKFRHTCGRCADQHHAQLIED